MTKTPTSMEWRIAVHPTDIDIVSSVVRSTAVFSEEEAVMAGSLVAERLEKGVDSGYYFLFAEQDKEVLGFTCYGPICCTNGSFDLYWIVVRQDQRAKGLGRQLLRRSEHLMDALGAKRIFAETSSRPEYGPARSFYFDSGFTSIASIPDFYSVGDAKVIYAKTLGKIVPKT